MFAEHSPIIRAFAQSSAEALAHVGVFVLATIQNPIERAAEDAARIARGEAEPSTLPLLTGARAQPVTEILEKA